VQWYQSLWLELIRAAIVLSAVAGAAIATASVLVTRKLLLTLIVAAVAPIPVRSNLKARGEFGKSWFSAGAIEILDLVTIAFAAAHGIDPIVQVYLLDYKILHHTITPGQQEKLADRLHEELLEGNEGIIRRLERWRDNVERWFDLDALKAHAYAQLRFVRVDRLDGVLSYSLSDFAWTGMSLGVLSTIAGLLSPLGTFRIDPKWEEATKGEGRVELDLSLWPARSLLSALYFTVRNIKLRKRKPPRLPPARDMHMEAQHGR